MRPIDGPALRKPGQDVARRASGLAYAAALAVVVSAGPPAAHAQPPPTALRSFLRDVIRLSESQLAAFERGEVVTKQLPSADKPEMAAFGAVRIAAEAETFLARFAEIASFKRGGSVLEIGRFSDPPRLADLAALTLEAGDFDAARKCKPGDCDVKLARDAMARVGSEIQWNAPDARAKTAALMRQMLLEYVQAYVHGGTSEMATYADKDKPLETPAEFKKLLAASRYLVEYAPEFHRYVEQYPSGRLAGATDFFYWIKDKFGPKPTVSAYHVTLGRNPGPGVRALVSSKQIYASHYFQAGLDLLALVNAPGGGFYLLDLYRARIDPPTGMLSGVLLGKIRGGIENGVAESLKTAKLRTEAK